MRCWCIVWQWQNEKGRKMIGKVASTFEVQHRVQCMANCTMSPICDSYNYRPSYKTCQLNSQHPRHSAQRQLSQHCLRQRLDLGPPELLRSRLSDRECQREH